MEKKAKMRRIKVSGGDEVEALRKTAREAAGELLL